MRLNENTKIVGSKVVLVPYEKEHVLKYHKWMEDEELRRLTGSERLSLDEEYEMQQNWRVDGDKLTFIILSRARLDCGCSEVHSMIGDVNLFLNVESEAGELEVMVAEQMERGSGAATEAVSLMIAYVVKELHVERFFVKITDDNAASLHLFKNKLKFRQVSHSEVFGEFTLELPLSEVEQFREPTYILVVAPYRSCS
uniref:N-acetyltransferase domain-containing protein n=1 Tax=Haemonchus contortus TaxID=6289 RepID=A0A7I4YBM5_HAECO